MTYVVKYRFVFLYVLVVKKNSFITLTPVAIYKKHFTSVIYKLLLSARVFVPGRPFQLSLIFVRKAGKAAFR